jgi:hypothetical protein
MPTDTKRKSPRKASPRKAASKKIDAANGQGTNGHQIVAEQDALAPEPAVTPPADAADPTTVNPPTEHVIIEQPKKLEHPYGEDTPIFVFHPKDGSDPIIFPKITQAQPTKHFFWKIRRKEPLFQAYDWMDLCKVPDAIQERVWLLDDAETGRFLAGWYAPIISPQGVEVPGES